MKNVYIVYRLDGSYKCVWEVFSSLPKAKKELTLMTQAINEGKEVIEPVTKNWDYDEGIMWRKNDVYISMFIKKHKVI